LADFEIDLQMLEELCSDLEEPVILFDTNLHIRWMNKIMHEHMHHTQADILDGNLVQRDVANTSENTSENIHRDQLKEYFIQLYGDADFQENSIVKKCFQTGKLTTSNHSNHGHTIKQMCIPIKHDTHVAYVLEILEERDHIKNTGYGNTTHEITSQDISPSKENHLAFVTYFLNTMNDPAFLVDEHRNLVSVNKEFDTAFKKSDILRDIIMKHVSSENFHAFLRKILRLSYSPIVKTIYNADNVALGKLYILKREGNKNTRVTHIKNSKKRLTRKRGS
jgi:transcriptional regulator with PAS, ATPase and Fis domain